VLLLDVQRLCACASSVEVAGMGIALALPAALQPAPPPDGPGAMPSVGLQEEQACCVALAHAFLSSGAQQLVLQPAGACRPLLLGAPPEDGRADSGRGWLPPQAPPNAGSAHFDEVAVSTAAHAYLAAAGQYAAAMQALQHAGWLRSWQVDRYSAAPAERDVAAAAADARTVVWRPAEGADLLKLLPGSLTVAQRRHMAVDAPVRLWSAALGVVASARLVRRP
jgi:hypothetical protein